MLGSLNKISTDVKSKDAETYLNDIAIHALQRGWIEIIVNNIKKNKRNNTKFNVRIIHHAKNEAKPSRFWLIIIIETLRHAARES